MARNFYFGADATMVSGSAAFSAAINSDAAAFGLTDAQALAYRAIDESLQSGYTLAITPGTRTPVAVSQKNLLIRSMQRSAKNLSDIIRATPSVNDAQLISLGLLPRAQPARRNAPDAPPAVRVLSVIGRIVTLRVCDPTLQSGRSKATGAQGALVHSYVGDAPPTDSRAYRFERFTSRTSVEITFPDDVASGATVWISACWVSARGEASSASSPRSFTLQGGPVVPATSPGLKVAA